MDYHSISSTPTGDAFYRFDTKRTQLGELLYRLKYRNAVSCVPDIADTVEEFFRGWNPAVDCIVSAPPSATRRAQPVVAIARELSNRFDLPFFENAIRKAEQTPQMKNIENFQERERVLQNAIQAGGGDVTGRSVLLFDDLVESGATLRCTARVLFDAKGAGSVYALALTRTR